MKSLEYLKSKNVKFKTLYYKEIPRTARDVERIYGCDLRYVLKSIVFVGETKNVIAVVPGDRRVSVEKLKRVIGQNTLRLAKSDEVLRITGYAIGGVSPFGVGKEVEKVIDKDVFNFDVINIGSGKAEVGIEIDTKDLKRVWEGIIADISE